MLTHSFCCFQGLSPAAERKLWNAGCLSWTQLPLGRHAFSSRKFTQLQAQVPVLESARLGRIADFFLNRLPPGHRLRLWPDFQQGVAFLDIETTGLHRSADLTLVGLWQAGKLRQFVRGGNLHEFLHVWRRVELLVTFNGARFDLPFVAREFRLNCLPPHIDLLAEARHYGLSGGLKSIERLLGIRRTPAENGTGEMAVELWNHYCQHHDSDSLQSLLAYNARDVRSLVSLAHHILDRSCNGFPAQRPPFSPTADYTPIPTAL